MTGQRPAQNSHGPAVDLFGDALAAVAQELARHLDPERKGLHISLIQQAVERSGASILGDARVTFGSALNKAQHRFVRVGTLFSVLNNAHRWFEAVGDRLFRWR